MNEIPLGRLHRLAPLADTLIAAAHATAAATRRFQAEKRRVRRGSIPLCGRETPLWNELARTARHFLRRRGEKAKLARWLGLSRQRLHLLLVAKTAYPDAERALELLAWVNARRRGVDPA